VRNERMQAVAFHAYRLAPAGQFGRACAMFDLLVAKGVRVPPNDSTYLLPPVSERLRRHSPFVNGRA
jgi:hypothetical protein